MKQPFKLDERARLALTPAARFAAQASLAAVISLGLGCSGEIDAIGATSGGSSGSGHGPGTGGTTASGGSSSVAGSGSGNPTGGTQGQTAGSGQGGSGQSGSGQGGDPNAIPAMPPDPVMVATPRLSRLSRQQWANTVRDLLKLTDISSIEADVSGDALIGFDNQADALYVTEQLRRQLADAAEKLADVVTGDDAALARVVPADAPTDSAARARAFVSAFGQRAFRRPLTEAEVSTHLALFDDGPTLYPGVDAFKAGVSLVIQAMLQSPHFLYRTELATAEAGATKVPLDDYEVGAKLAYAITNTMPDDELFAAAAAGQLRDPDSFAAQARRLLDSPVGLRGFENLNLQVYRLGTYDGIVRNPEIFPDFTPETPAAMRTEVLKFLDWVFAEGRGIQDFYTAPVGFVNSALAPIYGVTGSFTSDTFTKVDLDPSQRSGLLTQAGFLSSYITGTDPDIIHRGVYIATRILCLKLPPPDPNATSLVELEPDMTNRERVEATTGVGTCGEGCHAAIMNPLGFAFENYDAIGKYRTMDRGEPVNAADSYEFGGVLKPFTNGIELSHLLAEAKETHSCYVQNLMSYLHGRLLTREEEPVVDYFARVSRAGLLPLRDLQLAIVTSDPFVNRLP
jgi:hypothetical protein